MIRKKIPIIHMNKVDKIKAFCCEEKYNKMLFYFVKKYRFVKSRK